MTYLESGKMAYKLETIVKPILRSRYKDDQVKVIFRPQVQPWHAMSTITHEAALAVSIFFLSTSRKS